jgi:hypothetical protein
VGTLFSSEDEIRKKTLVVKLDSIGKDRYKADLPGPQTKGREGPRTVMLPIELDVTDEKSACLTIENQKIELRLGEWSEIIELRFKAGMLFNIHAITRFIAVSLKDVVRVYALPLQIHPLHSTWHYSSSNSFAKKLWKEVGPFLTLGWPQDTTGLEDGCINDDQFIRLCGEIFDKRIRILSSLTYGFREGVLASIFDDLDRIQHMFFHNRMDIVHGWYRLLDEYVGTVAQTVSQWSGKHRFLILSDHGFSKFEKKIHLNRWLLENGYLAMKNGGDDLSGVDWSRTKAYSVGLNSIYLNITGREGQGSVEANDIENLLNEIKQRLTGWKDAEVHPIQKVRLKHETFHGPYTRFGPDLVVGYAPGYRASAETGLGKIPATVMETNTDHWGADHCIEADAVPGVIFANRDLREFGTISFRDIPFLAIGKHLDQSNIKPPSQAAGQGQKDVEERLKGLGYL